MAIVKSNQSGVKQIGPHVYARNLSYFGFFFLWSFFPLKYKKLTAVELGEHSLCKHTMDEIM